MKRVQTYKGRAKLSRNVIKELYPAYDPTGHVPTKATQRGFTHKHKPTWLPKKSALTPAQWGRMRRGENPPYNYQKG